MPKARRKPSPRRHVKARKNFARSKLPLFSFLLLAFVVVFFFAKQNAWFISANAGNLVKNPTCDSNTNNWAAVGGTISLTATSPHGGSGSCLMKSNKNVTSYRMEDNPATVTALNLWEKYQATAWVRSDAAVGKPVSIILTQSGGTKAAATAASTPVNLTTSWQQISVSTTIDALDRTALDVAIEQTNASRNHSFQVDDVSLVLANNVPTAPVATNIANSLAPVGVTASGQTNVSVSNGVYTFAYTEAGNPVTTYTIDTNNAQVRKGLLKVREVQTNSYPVSFAGASYRKQDGTFLGAWNFQQVVTTAFAHKLWPNNILSLYFEDTLDGKTTKKRYDLELKKKTLIIHSYAAEPDASPLGNYAGFNFDRSEQTPNPKEIIVPYMESMPAVMAGSGSQYFYTRYIDYTKSNSNTALVRQNPVLYSSTSLYSSVDTRYIAGQNNVYPALDETTYITVSPSIDDTMAKVHRAPSSYRADMNTRVVWDLWNPFQAPGATRFQKVNNVLNQLNVYGLENLLITFHQWQNMGYDCGLPTHYPANPNFGGASELITFINAAKNAGHLIGLHQNYLNFYINSPYWDNGTNVALDPSGAWRKGWHNPNCTGAEQSYNIAADKMISYANQEVPSTQSDYQPNASYLDITTSMALNGFIDHSAANPNARTFAQVFSEANTLNDAVRSASGGPLSGEGRQSAIGSSDTWQAGFVDAVEREIVGRESAKVMPDYELKIVKPLMANQGMGYHGRWIGPGPTQVNDISPSTFPFDKYRAMQIAYGHTGFMGEATFKAPNIPIDEFYRYYVKEYYTFRELQSQYLSSNVQEILYRNASGEMVDLNAALKANLDFTQAQLRITYANGLTVYINYHPTDIWNVSVDGTSHVLPPYGWVASNPGQEFLEYSALVDAEGNPAETGTRADFVKTPNYIMVDGRGTTITFGNDFSGSPITFDKLKVVKPGGWSLTEQDDGSLLVNP